MRLDFYQAETAQVAKEQSSLLDVARMPLQKGKALSRLEENGVLHALQMLIGNAIGKAKQVMKANDEPVPVSAYDALAALARLRVINAEDLTAWNAAIGLRNRIVHEYMNIDVKRVLELVSADQHHFVVKFLLAPISDKSNKS